MVVAVDTDHRINVENQHCQSGNHIDIYIEMFRIMAINPDRDGANIQVEFAPVYDQEREPGVIDLNSI